MALDPFIRDNQLNLWLLAQTSLVIVARINSVGPGPSLWSEPFLVTQQLSVTSEDVLFGKPPEESTLNVALPVVQGTRTANTTPGLAPWLTQVGSSVILFLQDGKFTDEDLGAFAATPELVKTMRDLCNGPIPPGTGSGLYQLSELAKDDPDVKSVFEDLEPAVLDIVENDHKTVRMTLVKGILRVFTGIRLKRVMQSRPADVTLRANAMDIVKALLEEKSLQDLVIEGENTALISALQKAGEIISRNPEYVALMKQAAGSSN